MMNSGSGIMHLKKNKQKKPFDITKLFSEVYKYLIIFNKFWL